MTELRVGAEVGPVRVGPIAHGGHWVARYEGRVLFVRHGLEGELVRVRVTSLAKRFGRADVIEILEPSPHRVPAPCPIAGQCGGCDFQHVAANHQLEVKRQVVAEQLQRLAGIEWGGVVESFRPTPLGWRTRMRYHLSDAQRWGLRAHRSHDVIELPSIGCQLASPGLAHPDADVAAPELIGAETADGVSWSTRDDRVLLTEQAIGRDWSVWADGFWQVHPAAATTLVSAVLDELAPTPGQSALDLYCGVGLFAGAMVDAGVRVHGVEGSRPAVERARRNVPEATFEAGSVERVLPTLRGEWDFTVLDPPREGAGAVVMRELCARTRQAIAYVACDPAALARDLATAIELGWSVRALRAFDLFPSTHHVETVAVLTPPGG